MDRQEQDKPGVIAPPPLLYLLTLVAGLAIHLVFPVYLLPDGWLQLAIGLPLVAIAGFVGLPAFLAFGSAKTNVSPYQPTTTLVTQGLYRFSRNPIYLSLTLLLLGITVSLNALWPIVLLPVTLAVVTTGVIEREERYLERKFGQTYLEYKTRVRRWL